MRRRVTALTIALLVCAGTLVGCGSKGGQVGPLPTKRIDVTFHCSSVTPNGQRFTVGVGQRIELDVTADAPGEIHVHSSPEQEFHYDTGSSTIEVKPIRAPGLVTVESHTLDKVILQLQAQ